MFSWCWFFKSSILFCHTKWLESWSLGWLVFNLKSMSIKMFSNVGSDWLSTQLPASQRPYWKIIVNWHGFEHGILLLIQTTILTTVFPLKHILCPGDCLNIKIPSYQYRDPHVKHKMVWQPSYLYHVNPPYLGKMVFILRWGPGFKLLVVNKKEAHRQDFGRDINSWKLSGLGGWPYSRQVPYYVWCQTLFRFMNMLCHEK